MARCAAIVINPGAFGHYSYAIADALTTFEGPKVELHVSNPMAREAWRHRSVIAPYVTGTIQGFGRAGYHLAVVAAISQLPPPTMTVTLDALPAMDVAGRAGRLRARFADAGIDALLVTHLPNVRYLTSFTGSAGLVLVTGDALVFTTDGRYRTQAGEQLGGAGVDAQIEIGATVAAQRDAIARALDPGARVGLEAHAITWAQQQDFAETLRRARARRHRRPRREAPPREGAR